MKNNFTLKQTDGPLKLELPLWHDSPEIAGGFDERPISPQPITDSPDESNYQTQSPEFGVVFDQSNWVGGFGEGRVHEGNGNNSIYGYSDGVLAMYEHELIPGYQEDVVSVMVRDPSFENGETISDNWTASNVTLAASTDSDSGIGAMQITATANNGTATQTYMGRVQPLAGKEIKLVAKIKRLSGSGTALIRLTDSAGSTDSSTTSSTSYTTLEVTRTVDTSATSLAYTFLLDTDTDVFVVDSLYIIPSGGTVWNSRPITFKGSSAGARDSYYVPMGRCILRWHEGQATFHPVYIHDTAQVVALEAFGNTTSKLYAGLGDDVPYIESEDGDTWAAPSPSSSTKDYASKFVRAKNASQVNVLMKLYGTSLSINTDPSTTSSWSADIPVGTSDRPVTSILSTNGIVYVGKSDGLYVFDNTNSQMRDIEPDANFFVEADNFSASIGRGGVVYAAGGQSTFWRVWPAEEGAVLHRWLDLTELFAAPQFKGFGGRVVGLAQDRQNIWIMLADDLSSNATRFPYTFPFTFSRPRDSEKIRLITLRPPSRDQQDFISDNLLVAHTVTAFSNMTQAKQMGRFQEDAISSLFCFGNRFDSNLTGTEPHTLLPVITRLRLPSTVDNPRQAQTIQLRKTGDFYTPWIDKGFPDVEKAISKITIGSKNLDKNRTLTVYYKCDDDTDDDSTGWTQFPDISTVVNTSPSQTLSTDTTDAGSQIVCKRVRFKISFSNTTNTAAPPTVTSIVVHFISNPNNYRRFRAAVKLSDSPTHTLRRRREGAPVEATIEKLKLLEREPYVTVTTPFGDEYQAHIKFNQGILAKRVDAIRGGKTGYSRNIVIEGTEMRAT